MFKYHRLREGESDTWRAEQQPTWWNIWGIVENQARKDKILKALSTELHKINKNESKVE